MHYATLAACVSDLEKNGHLKRIACELDPHLEIAEVQRRAFANKSPALLFTNVKGCKFPMLGNLFGSMERTRFIFRHTLRQVDALLAAKANPAAFIKKPLPATKLLPALWNALPKTTSHGSVLSCKAHISDLPQLVSWPQEGGAFITLPLVYSEHPDTPGLLRSNLGMYRIQLSGGTYIPNKEIGLHYQLHRGIGPHHTAALAANKPLPVTIFVGGPPALTIAGIMPLPENVPELAFANVLAGHRIPIITGANLPTVPAEADFCITGYLTNQVKPEGPFGDHLGYYSLTHDYPVLHVTQVYHRPDAIFPFTAVGRPPQEDTVFGAFIHELTANLVPTVFAGIHEVHAVDAAGVHPLLLAIGSERYTPFENQRKPRELITQGLHLLGTTQTSLAKYVLLAAKNDNPHLSTQHTDEFFAHMLERTDFKRDLHILPNVTMDTLDYTGTAHNEGAKMLWVAAGEKKRTLATELPTLNLPNIFPHLRLFRPGIAVCQAPPHTAPRGAACPHMQLLAQHLASQTHLLAGLPLLIVVDDVDFATTNKANWLWVTFTRSDPATDTYGAQEFTHAKQWGCTHTLIIDARLKAFHAPALEVAPATTQRIDSLAVAGGPLAGIA